MPPSRRSERSVGVHNERMSNVTIFAFIKITEPFCELLLVLVLPVGGGQFRCCFASVNSRYSCPACHSCMHVSNLDRFFFSSLVSLGYALGSEGSVCCPVTTTVWTCPDCGPRFSLSRVWEIFRLASDIRNSVTT